MLALADPVLVRATPPTPTARAALFWGLGSLALLSLTLVGVVFFKVWRANAPPPAEGESDAPVQRMLDSLVTSAAAAAASRPPGPPESEAKKP